MDSYNYFQFLFLIYSSLIQNSYLLRVLFWKKNSYLQFEVQEMVYKNREFMKMGIVIDIPATHAVISPALRHMHHMINKKHQH